MWQVVVVIVTSFGVTMGMAALFYWKRDEMLKIARPKNSARQALLSAINVAVAGVLVAMSLHHILSEAVINVLGIIDSDINALYMTKIATMFYFMGFMFMFILEKVCVRHTRSHQAEQKIQTLVAAEDELCRSKKDDNIAMIVLQEDDEDSEDYEETEEQRNETEALQRYIRRQHRSHMVTYAFIYMSFCVHSVMAGLGSSLAARRNNYIFALGTLAFSVHKAMDIGIVAKGIIQLKLSAVAYIVLTFLFAFMTPAGVMLGHYMSANRLANSSLLAIYFLQLFTGGIFLYIALIEIFIEQFLDDPTKKFRKLFIFLVFYFITCFIAYLD